MKKFFYIFLLFIFTQTHVNANVDSCNSVFVSGSKNFNISHIRNHKFNFLTKDKGNNVGFDLAYCYGFSEKLYLGLGLGYFPSSSLLFDNKGNNYKHINDPNDIILEGDFIKLPILLRFFGDEFAGIMRIYLYGDMHFLFSLGTNAVGNADNDIFKQSVFKGNFSVGMAVGAGINVAITQCSNIFFECLFALRPFSTIEIKRDDALSNLKINSLILNFGTHLDFAKSSGDIDLS